jgi:hypothetical protein
VNVNDPGAEYIKQLFDMNAKAQRARSDMDAAVHNGLAQQYHKTLRENPEVLLAQPLHAARRHVGSLLAAKRQVAQSSAHPDIKAMRSNELDKAVRAVSEGTVRWVNSKLGKQP